MGKCRNYIVHFLKVQNSNINKKWSPLFMRLISASDSIGTNVIHKEDALI